ncbi:MAG: hypothetical protein ACYDCD_07455 [Candidatus Acidiferrales bacterium]
MNMLRGGRNPKVRKPEQIRWKLWNELVKIARWYPNPKDFRARAIILGENYGCNEKELIAAGVIEARSEKNFPPRAQFSEERIASLTPGVTEEEIVSQAEQGKAEFRKQAQRILNACITVTPQSPQPEGKEPADLAGDDENPEKKK